MNNQIIIFLFATLISLPFSIAVICNPDIPNGCPKTETSFNSSVSTNGTLFHNVLYNLNWASAGHIIDSKLDLNNNRITEASKVTFQSGDLLEPKESGTVEYQSNSYYATITNPDTTVEFYPSTFTNVSHRVSSQYDVCTSFGCPWGMTDPSISVLGGSGTGAGFLFANGVNTNSVFNIDLGDARVIDRLYYENYHQTGSNSNWGWKTFTLWGSNTESAFTNTAYATDTNWVQLTVNNNTFGQHPASNNLQNGYINVTSSVAYRYYRIKVADGWGGALLGMRRLTLQDAFNNSRKNVVMSEYPLTYGRIPIVGIGGQLVDYPGFTFNNYFFTLPRIAGGNGSTDRLTLYSTSGAGGSGSGIDLKCGTTGSITAMKINGINGNTWIKPGSGAECATDLCVGSNSNSMSTYSTQYIQGGITSNNTWNFTLGMSLGTLAGQLYGAGAGFGLKSYANLTGASMGYAPKSEFGLFLKSVASGNDAYAVLAQSWRDDKSTWMWGNANVNGTLNITHNVYIDGNISVKRPYGMYSSTEDQTLALADTAYPVTFNWTEDSYLITKQGDSNFSIAQSGDYLIELSAVFQTAVANKKSNLWVQIHNGTAWNNVPRSNTQLTMRTANSDYVVAVPFIIDIVPTEKFRIMWAGDDSGVFLNYMTNTSYAPETPSIIMTVSKISEITP